MCNLRQSREKNFHVIFAWEFRELLSATRSHREKKQPTREHKLAKINDYFSGTFVLISIPCEYVCVVKCYVRELQADPAWCNIAGQLSVLGGNSANSEHIEKVRSPDSLHLPRCIRRRRRRRCTRIATVATATAAIISNVVVVGTAKFSATRAPLSHATHI